MSTSDELHLKGYTKRDSLAKNAGLMSIAVFISRILGLVREQVFAFLFGAGLLSDAYIVAFRIPNLLRDLFAEGALSSAFVTVFSRAETKEKAQTFFRHVMIVMTLLLGVITVAIYKFAPDIVLLLAKDFGSQPGKMELTIRLTQLFSPFLFFVSSAALAMGVLNSLGSFFLPSLGAAAFNLGNVVVGGALALLLM